MVHRFTNQAGIDLIKSFEGLQLNAYPDPGTHGKPWTIGYGHTKAVYPSMTITPDTAESLLKSDLYDAENAVASTTVTLNDNQFAALVSFVFNLGAGVLDGEHMSAALGNEDYAGITSTMLMYNHAAGRVLPGLTHRRQAEVNLFNS